MTHRGQ